MGLHAWLVTSLNPKGIIFFVAFFPQFVDPHAPFWPQVLTLQATFLVIAFSSVLVYAAFASQARGSSAASVSSAPSTRWAAPC